MMTTMQKNNGDPERAQLVEVLWSLKQGFRRYGTGSLRLTVVQFSWLLNDESYREQIITKAAESGIDELQLLAARARLLNRPGRLVATGHQYRQTDVVATNHSLVNSDTTTFTSTSTHTTSAETSASKRFFSLGMTIATLLITLVGGGVGYLAALNGGLEALKGRVQISGSLIGHTVWKADHEYELNGLVFVEHGAGLAIEPGTRIYGKPGSALVITQGATLYARGNPKAPIIFSSARPVGQRQSGDWGGVVLLGDAPLNRTQQGHIEGIDDKDPRGSFGGSNPEANCGVLEYVRIEFAGYAIAQDNELNGLTLGGCGNATVVQHVQVHKANDDGIEIFGGTVNLSHILITGAHDDGLDWDMGWTGWVQFLIVQMHTDGGDSAIEADNDKQQPDAQPRSAPQLYNITLLGAERADKPQRGLHLRHGTAGIIRNFLIAGFAKDALNIGGTESVEQLKHGALTVEHGLIRAPMGAAVFAQETDAGDDGGFDEAEFWRNPQRSVGLDENLRLAENAFDPLRPNFIPQADSPANHKAERIPVGEFWDEAANYLGALRPGSGRSWTNDWTAYPED